MSYGKDSLACLFAVEQLGWPLDRIVHAEVWATDDIPADLPPMVEFKAKADRIIKERWGIEVEHVCAMRDGEKLTYEKLFYRIPQRKRRGEDARRKEGSILGFPTIDNHFSTIGVVGMNEMCENFMGKTILDEDARQFCIEVGAYIRQALVRFQEETGHLFNYEATPAESTSYRFALGDKKIYPDIITQGSGKDCYYTNSCHIPVKLIKSINETFAHQDDLQVQFTGGTVIHCYLEGAISGDHAKQIVKAMFEKYRVPYMSLSPISRYCNEHGYIQEHVTKCPYCKYRLKLFQRITGYLRCVDNFNRGKAAEFNDRVQLGGAPDEA